MRKLTSGIFVQLNNVSVKSTLQHSPPPGIPRAFDSFDVPGRREFDYQSLPGGGEFFCYIKCELFAVFIKILFDN